MEHRLLRQLRMLVLGIVMALGASLSWVQANGMVVNMALASDTGTPGHGGCEGCPGDGGDAACQAACASAAAAVTPAAPALTMHGFRRPAPPIAARAFGWSSAPDPSPPEDEAAG